MLQQIQFLYLLSFADGIYSTIQVVDQDGDKISDVEVTVERQFSGIWTVIGQETTDDAGLVTFWLNPDFVHDFTFTKSGLTTYETSFAPTQTSYSVTLAGGTTTVNDYTKGMAYTILPSNTSLTNLYIKKRLLLASSISFSATAKRFSICAPSSVPRLFNLIFNIFMLGGAIHTNTASLNNLEILLAPSISTTKINDLPSSISFNIDEGEPYKAPA